MSLRFGLDEAPPDELEVGDGTVLLLRGWTAAPALARASHFLVELGDRRWRMPHSKDVRWDVDRQLTSGGVASGFWLPITIGPELAGQSYRLRLSLGAHTLIDSELTLVHRRPPLRNVTTPLAICLTTYNPDLALFQRQVDSLRAQSFREWTCLVQDDRSRPEVFAEIERVCSADPRFLVQRNAVNFGFYRNFERCLRNVPASVQWVALCDQDDEWYPDKLQRGLDRLTGDVQLVYSDMRLVDVERRLISNTYWAKRRNNYRSLATLMVANTVTGAASIFRRAVLDKALPFPPYVESIFHDHWLAVVSMLLGGLDYIDEPLYDYTQHGSNVIGHTAFDAVSTWKALSDHAGKLLGLAVRPERLKKLLTVMPLYYTEYRKLQLYRTVLELRFPSLSRAQRRVIDLFADRLWNAPQLMIGAHLGVLYRGDTTNMVEFNLGVALALHKTLGPLVPSMVRARDLWDQIADARQKRTDA